MSSPKRTTAASAGSRMKIENFASLVSRGDNKPLQVKQLIESMRGIAFGTHNAYAPAIGQLIQCVCKLDTDDIGWGALDMSFSDRGKFFAHIQEKVYRQTLKDYPDLTGCEYKMMFDNPTIEGNSDVLDIIAGDASAITLAVEAVQVWSESANQYADSRLASLRKQLENAGVAKHLIDAACDDPATVRRLIAESRQMLIATLRDIQTRMMAADPMNPVTIKEKELYKKHKDWFENGDDTDDVFLPNDNAVPYALLFVLLINDLADLGGRDPARVGNALNYLFQVIHTCCQIGNLADQVDAMRSTPNRRISEIDVGSYLRSLVNATNKFAAMPLIGSLNKLTPNTLLTPARLYRMACCFFQFDGPWSILNATGHTALAAVLGLRETELKIERLLATGTAGRSGNDGQSTAMSIIWLMIVGRSELWANIVGRNDLSVPNIVAKMTKTTAPVSQTTPREWSWIKHMPGVEAPRSLKPPKK